MDADACPNVIKEILFRAAQRCEVLTTLVANHRISIPSSPFIKSRQVEPGFDVADNYIAQRVSVGDIVITGDIPLAAEVVEKGAKAISPRGALFTAANIKQRLAMRNLMEELRNTGEVQSKTPAIGNVEKQQFANTLDKLLAVKK